MESYILILVGTVLVNNIVLTQILGLCPFKGVSQRLETDVPVIFSSLPTAFLTARLMNLAFMGLAGRIR